MPPDDPADNAPSPNDASLASQQGALISVKTDQVLTELARLIGRQMAREHFASQKRDSVISPDIDDKH